MDSRQARNEYLNWLMDAATAGIDWDNPPPQEMLTEELCIASLEDAPESLGRMPVELRTANVCFKAVCIDDDALQFVPENLREEIKARKDAITEEQWLNELLWYSGNHYLKLPKKLLTPEFCRAMVERNGNTIKLVPEELTTPELRAIAKENEDMDLVFHRIDEIKQPMQYLFGHATATVLERSWQFAREAREKAELTKRDGNDK